MTSFIRSTAILGAALTVLATGGLGLAASASAATADPASSTTAGIAATPTATSTSSPSGATGGTAATPTGAATPTATATASPSATPSPESSASSSATSSSTAAPDPSLADMNADGNHTMGSTIPVADDATGSTSLTLHSLAKVAATATAAASPSQAGIAGLDVSAYQPGINWKTVAKNGAKFVYVKATEGTTYTSSTFASQYNGAYAAGLTRGAYHFANPNKSTGAVQATYFVKHGGNWSADGRTLPPLLDIEYGSASQGGTCWGKSQAAMVAWIADFSSTVLKLTGTRPAIYSTTDWWRTCTGNSAAFSANPLMIAYYSTGSKPGTLPASWKNWSIWQWADAGTFPGDQDVFNGTAAALKVMTLGTTASSVALPAAKASSTLATGATLASGKSIKSSNSQFTLAMQSDGNLVLSGNGHVMWYSKTNGNKGAHLAMQSDGNLVIYSAAGKALWATSTTGTKGKLVVASSGQLQVSTSVGVAWTSGWTGTSYLSPGTTLKANQSIHDTTGYLQAIMQSDGNFVVYINKKAKYQTKTGGHSGARVAMQSDGNLVVYSSANKVLWFSKTKGKSAKLNMQSDGNLVLTIAGKVKWQSKTHI